MTLLIICVLNWTVKLLTGKVFGLMGQKGLTVGRGEHRQRQSAGVCFFMSDFIGHKKG